jgi:hypothetical protein
MMVQMAVAAFIGAFAAYTALAEITGSNKVFRYLGAFVVGLLLALAFAWLAGWVAGAFAHIPK